jgi:hypothetical protein
MSKSRPTLPAQMNAIAYGKNNFFDEGNGFLAETPGDSHELLAT